MITMATRQQHNKLLNPIRVANNSGVTTVSSSNKELILTPSTTTMAIMHKAMVTRISKAWANTKWTAPNANCLQDTHTLHTRLTPRSAIRLQHTSTLHKRKVPATTKVKLLRHLHSKPCRITAQLNQQLTRLNQLATC